MTDLTDKWKKGELTQDFYYVRSAWSDETEIRYVQNPECGDVYEEIIAPVPNYEEWQASYNCMLENEVLRLKLAKMEELLKECRRYIDIWGYTDTHGNALFPQIEEALK